MVGLLCHLVGLPEDIDTIDGCGVSIPYKLKDFVSEVESAILMTMNDDGKTFEEIANHLEGESWK